MRSEPAVLEGAQVVLRPVETDDLDPLATILAEPEVARWWPRHDRARLENELLEHPDPAGEAWTIVTDGLVAGIVEATEERDPDYRSAAIDIAVSTRWHGTGVAVDALRTLIRHLVGTRHHHHLTIDPAVDNARAIRCYEKVGFRPVGVLRRNERGPDGTFHDALLMDLLADELLD